MPTKLRARLRRIVFVLHLWIGLTIGLIFAVVGVSGSAIVYRRELDGIARPYLWHLNPAPGSRPLPMAELQKRIRADHPEAKPRDVSLFLFQPWDRAALTTYIGSSSFAIDPYSGQTLAVLTGTKTLPGWAKDLHTELLAGERGEAINGYAALAASLLLLSGLWLWWPATRRQVRLRLTVKRKISFRRTTYDLHNVMGFYSLVALLVVTLSGVGLCFNGPVQKFVFAHTDSKRPRLERVAVSGSSLDPDALLDLARLEVPDGRFVLATFPTAPKQPFSAMFQRTGMGFFPYVSLKIDPYSGRILQRDDDADSSFGRKIMRQVAVLHFGFWGGTTTKILYVLLGLVPLGLYVTGILLWWNRLRAKRRAAQRRRVPTD